MQKDRFLVVAFKFAEVPDEAHWTDKFVDRVLLRDWFTWERYPFTVQLAELKKTTTVDANGIKVESFRCTRSYSCTESDGVRILTDRHFTGWSKASEFYLLSGVSREQLRSVRSFFEKQRGKPYNKVHRASNYFLPLYLIACTIPSATYEDPDKIGYDKVSAWTCASVVVAALNSANILHARASTVSPWDLEHTLRAQPKLAHRLSRQQIVSVLSDPLNKI